MGLLQDFEDNIVRLWLDPKKEDQFMEIITILRKRANKRSLDELGTLYLLIKEVEFFSKFWEEMPSETILNLLSELQHEFIPKGEAVFRIGETGKAFYLILTGSVCVLLPDKNQSNDIRSFASRLSMEKAQKQKKTKTNAVQEGDILRSMTKNTQKSQNTEALDEESSSRRNSINSGASTPRSQAGGTRARRRDSRSASAERVQAQQKTNTPSLFSGRPEPKNDDSPLSEDEILNLFPNHLMLNQLNRGSHFGEIALSNNTTRYKFRDKNQNTRTASVVCRENCHFIKLGSRAYREIIKEYHDANQQKIMKMLKAMPLLDGWRDENFFGLIRQMKVVPLVRNDIIFDVGDPCDQVFIVKNGEVELSKVVECEVNEFAMKNKKLYTMIDSKDIIQLNRTWRKEHDKLSKKMVAFAVVGDGQVVGDDEITQQRATRITKAIVRSPYAEVYALDTMKFIENAPNPQIYMKRMKRETVKKSWRDYFSKGLLAIKTRKVEEVKVLKKYEKLQIDKILDPDNTPAFIPINGMGISIPENLYYNSTPVNYKDAPKEVRDARVYLTSEKLPTEKSGIESPPNYLNKRLDTVYSTKRDESIRPPTRLESSHTMRPTETTMHRDTSPPARDSPIPIPEREQSRVQTPLPRALRERNESAPNIMASNLVNRAIEADRNMTPAPVKKQPLSTTVVPLAIKLKHIAKSASETISKVELKRKSQEVIEAAESFQLTGGERLYLSNLKKFSRKARKEQNELEAQQKLARKAQRNLERNNSLLKLDAPSRESPFLSKKKEFVPLIDKSQFGTYSIVSVADYKKEQEKLDPEREHLYKKLGINKLFEEAIKFPLNGPESHREFKQIYNSARSSYSQDFFTTQKQKFSRPQSALRPMSNIRFQHVQNKEFEFKVKIPTPEVKSREGSAYQKKKVIIRKIRSQGKFSSAQF